MEPDRVVSVKREKVAYESLADRIRRREKLVISGALRQLQIEMMAFIGRPSPEQLISFFKQLHGSDLDVAANIIKDLLIKSSRSVYYIMSRFRTLVRAKTLIRHSWLASRFRFAMKIQALLVKWRNDEAEIRRRLQDCKLHHRVDDNATVLEQFLALEAPVELKRLVYVIFFKKLQREWLTKLRQWKQRVLEYNAAKEAAMRLATHAERQKQIRDLQVFEPPAKPPHLDWYQTLHQLTPTDRFEKCIQIQLSYQQKIHDSLAANNGGGGARSVEMGRRGSVVPMRDLLTALDEHDQDTSWIALTMMGMGRQVRQMESRLSVTGNIRMSMVATSVIPSYTHVRSKIAGRESFSLGGGSPSPGGRSSASRRTNTTTDGAAPAVRSLAQLRADLPTLSSMKSEPWNVPPRMEPGSPAFFARPSETPTLRAMDPFTKSLVLKGITAPPATMSVVKERLYNTRKDAMGRASQELRGALIGQTVKQQMRSERVLRLVLEDSRGEDSGKGQNGRPLSSSVARSHSAMH